MGVKAATFDLGGHSSAHDSRWYTATKVVPHTASLILETYKTKRHRHPIYKEETRNRQHQQIFLFGKKENRRYITDSGLHQS